MLKCAFFCVLLLTRTDTVICLAHTEAAIQLASAPMLLRNVPQTIKTATSSTKRKQILTPVHVTVSVNYFEKMCDYLFLQKILLHHVNETGSM